MTLDGLRVSGADRVAISSMFSADVVWSVGNSMTTLVVPWFVLVTVGIASSQSADAAGHPDSQHAQRRLSPDGGADDHR
jgi:hypothetical protein